MRTFIALLVVATLTAGCSEGLTERKAQTGLPPFTNTESQPVPKDRRAEEHAVSVQVYPETRDNNRFQDLGNGVILDSETGLEWTQSDNGATINGKEAATYCERLALAGGGWRLPEITEIETLCSQQFEHSIYSQGGMIPCRIHSIFRVTGAALCSATRSPYRPEDGRIFNYTLYVDECRRISQDINENPFIAPFSRVLCVRSSSKNAGRN
jgi:hypothetical protein